MWKRRIPLYTLKQFTVIQYKSTLRKINISCLSVTGKKDTAKVSILWLPPRCSLFLSFTRAWCISSISFCSVSQILRCSFIILLFFSFLNPFNCLHDSWWCSSLSILYLIHEEEGLMRNRFKEIVLHGWKWSIIGLHCIFSATCDHVGVVWLVIIQNYDNGILYKK